jgi:multidrug efflux pump subunit AcrA (membrane-fusion protein)
MFVHERIQEGIDDKALLAPQQGVTHNDRGEPTAMVVNGDGNIDLRVLKTDRAIGDQWLVTDGLAAGDRLVVQGLQGIKPGVKVGAKEVLPTDATKDASADPVKPPVDGASKAAR